jgi:hypothetical protein
MGNMMMMMTHTHACLKRSANVGVSVNVGTHNSTHTSKQATRAAT